MIPFVKMHADGNDFLLVEAQCAGANRAALSRALCDRHRGVGADGVEWMDERDGETHIDLSNADGSEAEISGNGTRCVAAWWAMSHDGDATIIHTGAGARPCRILQRSNTSASVATEMEVFHWQRLTMEAAGARYDGIAVNTGNPHFVIVSDQIPGNWQELGSELTVHPMFPHGTNVEFVRIDAADAITFRIHERGAGPTQSSGTGSTASAVAAIATMGLASTVRVRSEGGEQTVAWSAGNRIATLTGTAHLVARGEAYL